MQRLKLQSTARMNIAFPRVDTGNMATNPPAPTCRALRTTVRQGDAETAKRKEDINRISVDLVDPHVTQPPLSAGHLSRGLTLQRTSREKVTYTALAAPLRVRAGEEIKLPD